MIHTEESTSPRARRRVKNLEMILETAMSLVITSGWDGFSMHRLAKAVDYTPGALYRYFNSKDEILSALVVRTLEELRVQIQRQLALAPEAPLVQLLLAARCYQTFAEEAPHRFGLLAMMMADPKELLVSDETANPVVTAMLKTLAPLQETIEAAMTGGMLRQGDPAQKNLALFVSLQGALQLRKLNERAPTIFDVPQLIEELTQTLLLGWGAKSEDIKAAFESIAHLDPSTATWSYPV